MYKVIESFTDLQDANHLYKVGDEYPRKGMAVDEKRVKELLSSANRRKKPLIEEVEKPKATEKPKTTTKKK